MAYNNENEIHMDKWGLLKSAYDVLDMAKDRGYFDEHDDDSEQELDEKAQAHFVLDDIEQHYKQVRKFYSERN